MGSGFQKQVAPNLDTRRVEKVSYDGTLFELMMEDGEKLKAKAVRSGAWHRSFLLSARAVPGIPRELAPHSVRPQWIFSVFTSERVAV